MSTHYAVRDRDGAIHDETGAASGKRCAPGRHTAGWFVQAKGESDWKPYKPRHTLIVKNGQCEHCGSPHPS